MLRRLPLALPSPTAILAPSNLASAADIAVLLVTEGRHSFVVAKALPSGLSFDQQQRLFEELVVLAGPLSYESR